MKTVLKKGRLVTLLASYCGEDGCKEDTPCTDCVKMANQFMLEADVVALYVKQVCDKHKGEGDG